MAKWSLVLSATSNVPSTGPNSLVRDNRRSAGPDRYLSMWSALTVHRPLQLIQHESKQQDNESHIFDLSELFSAQPPSKLTPSESLTASELSGEVQLKQN